MLYNNRLKALELSIFEPNFKPIALLRAKKIGYAFLVTQLVPGDDRAVFCLADYGHNHLRIEVIDINKIEAEAQRRGDKIEPDPDFRGNYNLAVYAKVADYMGTIVTEEHDEMSRNLFQDFSQVSRYNDENKNLRRLKFGLIW